LNAQTSRKHRKRELNKLDFLNETTADTGKRAAKYLMGQGLR
jgi:hypothetical protein